MANEFIVRKGLVVEGASSGTVVNVLGSLGQLFSVTDNLTGSIFSVSDISGVPIFDVNSDGNTGIGTSSSTAKLFVNSTSDGEKIRWGRNNALMAYLILVIKVVQEVELCLTEQVLNPLV